MRAVEDFRDGERKSGRFQGEERVRLTSAAFASALAECGAKRGTPRGGQHEMERPAMQVARMPLVFRPPGQCSFN